ncbi:MAG: hypothetical protein NTW69_06435 [Chloroflexi bacterium]|nr:hypothetical protein [Chloroflexota bacterium]
MVVATQTPVTVVEDFDPFASASNPVAPVYELWGMVEINAWACHLQKGTGKVPFDATNPDHKRVTAIDLFIAPLAEQDITNTKSCEDHHIAESADWAGITLKSIKALGIDNIREINGKYARVEKVDGKPYFEKGADKKTATPKGFERHFKFVALYDTEAACRDAYLAAGGKSAQSVNVLIDVSDTEKQTAMAFLKVIVTNAAKSASNVEAAKIAVTVALAGYPSVAKYFTAESVEVLDLINASLNK